MRWCEGRRGKGRGRMEDPAVEVPGRGKREKREQRTDKKERNGKEG